MKNEFLIVTAAIIQREGRVLICRRPRGKRQAGYFEFPGGKLETGESPRQGLQRELREELGVESNIGLPYEVLSHEYEFGTVLLLFFQAEIIGGQPRPLHHDAVVWAEIDELDDYKFLEADKSLVKRIMEER